MNTGKYVLFPLLIIVLVGTGLWANPGDDSGGKEEQEATSDKPDASDETAAMEKVSLNYHVLDTAGDVEVKLPDAKDAKEEGSGWTSVRVGTELPPGTKLSTGIGANLVVTLGDYGSILVKELSQGKIGPLSKRGETLDGRIDLGSGSVRVHIDGKRVDGNFRIATPRSVAAVRGSIVEVLTRGDTGDEVFVNTGHLDFPNLPSKPKVTAQQRVYEKGLSGEYLTNIESAQLDFLASIGRDGRTRAENRALRDQVSGSLVDLFAPEESDALRHSTDLSPNLEGEDQVLEEETGEENIEEDDNDNRTPRGHGISDLARELQGLGDILGEPEHPGKADPPGHRNQ